jgi:hypothetical protein
MNNCAICGKPAIYEAYGGAVMQTADSVGDSYGFDRAYPQNKEMRCKEHQLKPDASFGRLWKWHILPIDDADLCGRLAKDDPDSV